MNSAILAGGLPQLIGALIGAAFIVCAAPAEAGNGWTRWRVAAFFVGWQAFTPLQPWYYDVPALLVCTLVMEVVYRRFAKKAGAA